MRPDLGHSQSVSALPQMKKTPLKPFLDRQATSDSNGGDDGDDGDGGGGGGGDGDGAGDAGTDAPY